MKIVAGIRIALALVLTFDIPLLLRAAILLMRGGVRAIHGWVVHLVVEGRAFDIDLAEKHRQIVEAYLQLAVMVFVLPIMLYVLQRRVAHRVAAKQLL